VLKADVRPTRTCPEPSARSGPELNFDRSPACRCIPTSSAPSIRVKLSALCPNCPLFEITTALMYLHGGTRIDPHPRYALARILKRQKRVKTPCDSNAENQAHSSEQMQRAFTRRAEGVCWFGCISSLRLRPSLARACVMATTDPTERRGGPGSVDLLPPAPILWIVTATCWRPTLRTHALYLRNAPYGLTRAVR